MANLEVLFQRAESELPCLKRRRTKTQEVLELTGVQGVAWRPLNGTEILQIYPPTKGRNAFREGAHFVLKNVRSECRYYDPNHNLKPNQYSYVGCNCSNLTDTEVWGWIKEAYKNLKRDKYVLNKPESLTLPQEQYALKEEDLMATKSIEISEQLYDRFYRVVSTKLKSPRVSYAKAIQSAAEAALTRFLDSLERDDKKDDKV